MSVNDAYGAPNKTSLARKPAGRSKLNLTSPLCLWENSLQEWKPVISVFLLSKCFWS